MVVRGSLWLVGALAALTGGTSGCTWMSYLGSSDVGLEHGKTFFIGGAGPVGQAVGTMSVPRGLRTGGWPGAVEVFAWQSVVGGTLRDQVDRGRNLKQAERLARRIQDYQEQYPGRPVNIVALSGGTGVATWALEALPENCRVHAVVFLASSLSQRYDLSAAVRHIDTRLYAFNSQTDSVLRVAVPMTGPIDRDTRPVAAGLYGFALPPGAGAETRELYRARVSNIRYRTEYALYGHRGGHTGATSRVFVQYVVTPLLTPGTLPGPVATAARRPVVGEVGVMAAR